MSEEFPYPEDIETFDLAGLEEHFQQEHVSEEELTPDAQMGMGGTAIAGAFIEEGDK